MVIYRFPSNEGDKDAKDKQFQGKLPDFIYIDDDKSNGSKSKSQSDAEYFEALKKLNSGSYPAFLRVITFIGAFILTIWSVGLLIGFLFLSLLSILTFFQWKDLNQSLPKFWKVLCRMSAFALSLAVATFSPGFGFGITAVYLLMQGENPESGFMGRILSKRIHPENHRQN